MSKVNLSADAIKKAAENLRVISHPVRLRIIQLLSQSSRTVGNRAVGELSVGEVAEECDIAHNAASTHLKLLERSGLLGNTRRGKSVCYHITDSHLIDLLRCIEKRFKKGE